MPVQLPQQRDAERAGQQLPTVEDVPVPDGSESDSDSDALPPILPLYPEQVPEQEEQPKEHGGLHDMD